MAGRFRSVADAIRSISGGVTADAHGLGHLIEAMRDVEIVGVRPNPRSIVWKLRVIRPDDMLVLDFRGANLVRSGKKLKRADPGKPAWLIVEHQPQAFADAAYIETADQATNAGAKDLKGHEDDTSPPQVKTVGIPATPVPIRAAGESRVAYIMPAGIDSYDLTLESLLDACRDWELALDSSAVAEPDILLAGGRAALSQFGSIARSLHETLDAARSTLAATIDARQFDGLDRVADRIAGQSADAVAAGRVLPARSLTALASAEIAALLPDASDDGASLRTAADLYVRTAAAAGAVSKLERAGVDIGEISKLPKGYFGMLLRPHPPGINRTAIEMPWRLIASPLPGAGFDHATAPVVRGNRTELWHTRLGPENGLHRVGDMPPGAGRKLRYIWSPDYPELTGDPINFTLTGLDRQMIVKLTAGFDEVLPDNGGRFTPRAVDARRLIMTALGGTLDVDRRWQKKPDGVDLLAWTHRLSQGRDSYVRVEYSGFLFPFGHAATLVKLSERKFQWRGAGRDRVAILRQRFFIVVREKRRAYPNAAPQPDAGRTMPFDAIEVMLDTTPDLAQPGGAPDQKLSAGFYSLERPERMAFWPARSTAPSVLFDFPLVGIDAAGRRVPFSMPVMFVSEVLNRQSTLTQIRTHYNAQSLRRTAATMNATMRFADIDDPLAADVDLPAQSLLFKSENPVGGMVESQKTALQQQPIVESARVRLASVERLTGQSLVPEVVFDPTYIAHGFSGPNLSELFLSLPTRPALDFGASGSGSDAVGGVASPSMKPKALSRRHGVMSGTAAGNVTDGQFRPQEFFEGAKLLGFFDLGLILKPVALGPESPVLTSTELPAGGGLGERIETRFHLSQQLGDSPIPALKLNQGGTSTLDLDATTTLFKNGDPPRSSVEGTLLHFKLNLVGVLVIHFDRLHFLRVSGRKPDVDVDLNPQTGVTFGGPLEFVNTLKDYIPANGFSDPPDLQVTPQGITAGYTLGLPAIQCGILSLSNISFGASFSLPFNGDDPTARFNFAERHNTFNLTVSLFGGGGFVALVVGTSGVKEIEAALEFGAQIAINLGVASGSVYIKGGFYFHYSMDPEGVEFEGYVELGGRLSVLGLISVSLTFHLSLTYESKALPDKADGSPRSQSRLFGQATLVVEIEILFFSASVKVKVEKTFAGSESDPLFAHFITDQSVWDDYCAAFA